MTLGKKVAIVGLTFSSVFLTNALKAQTLLERGTYLVKGVVACGNCHTPKGAEGRYS